jgi:hypothetical protein
MQAGALLKVSRKVKMLPNLGLEPSITIRQNGMMFYFFEREAIVTRA